MSQQIDACAAEIETRLQAREIVLTPTAASSEIGPLGENLVFLISQPRSGSTLLQRILAGHTAVFATAEPWIMLHPLHALKCSGYTADYNAEWARNALSDFCESLPDGEKDYVRAVREMAVSLYNKALKASGKSHFVDKTPRYYCILPELRRTFPAARFVFLVRNPLAILASIIESWTKEDWKKMEQFRRDLLEAPGLLAAAIKDFGADALVVRYEELAADPEGVVGRLCAALGLEFQPEMLEYGSRQKPRGSMGDQVGVDTHNQTVTTSVAKWRQTLATSEAKHFAFRYVAAINPEALSGLGYSRETLLANVVSIPGATLEAALSSAWVQWTNEFFDDVNPPTAPMPSEAPAAQKPIPQPSQRPAWELTAQPLSDETKLKEIKLAGDELPGIANTFKNMADKRAARGDLAGARQLLTKALYAAPDHPALLAAIEAIDRQCKETQAAAPQPQAPAHTLSTPTIGAPRNASPQALLAQACALIVQLGRPNYAQIKSHYPAFEEALDAWITPRLGFSMTPNPHGRIFPLVEEKFQGWEGAMRKHAAEVLPFINSPKLAAIPEQKLDEITPYWRNDYFPPGDARLAYAMVARHRPARIIECGCGNSTKFMRRAATDFETGTRIFCIDPEPRADIRGVADEFHQASAASVDPAYFGQLAPGDFLFIDGSHLLMNGSDCTHLFLNVLPRLQPGVWVHIHDVFLPHDYPYELHVSCRFNEQYALAMLFLSSNDWLPALPIYYAHKKQILPHGGGSLWMLRVNNQP